MFVCKNSEKKTMWHHWASVLNGIIFFIANFRQAISLNEEKMTHFDLSQHIAPKLTEEHSIEEKLSFLAALGGEAQRKENNSSTLRNRKHQQQQQQEASVLSGFTGATLSDRNDGGCDEPLNPLLRELLATDESRRKSGKKGQKHMPKRLSADLRSGATVDTKNSCGSSLDPFAPSRAPSGAITHSTAIAVTNAPAALGGGTIILDVMETRKGTMAEMIRRSGDGDGTLSDLPIGGATDTNNRRGRGEGGSNSNRQLFIMLTGNPAILAFYRNFASYLSTQAGRYAGGGEVTPASVGASSSSSYSAVHLDVVVIGFAGHSACEEAVFSASAGGHSSNCNVTELPLRSSSSSPAASSSPTPATARSGWAREKRGRKSFSVPEQTILFDEVIKRLFVVTSEGTGGIGGGGGGKGGFSYYDKLGYRHIYVGGHSCSTFTALPVVAKYMGGEEGKNVVEEDEGAANRHQRRQQQQLFTRFFMIAPTILDLPESPKALRCGWWLFNPLFRTFVGYLMWFIFLFTSVRMRFAFIKWTKPKVQSHLLVGLAQSLTPSIVESALCLGHSEIEVIRDIAEWPNPLSSSFGADAKIGKTNDENTNTCSAKTSTAALLKAVAPILVVWWPQRDAWAPLCSFDKVAAVLGRQPHNKNELDGGGGASPVSLADRDFMPSVIFGHSGHSPRTASHDEERSAKAGNGARSSVFPICRVVSDPQFPHAWSSYFSFAAATVLVLPYLQKD